MGCGISGGIVIVSIFSVLVHLIGGTNLYYFAVSVVGGAAIIYFSVATYCFTLATSSSDIGSCNLSVNRIKCTG